jgi:hypothetical protein
MPSEAAVSEPNRLSSLYSIFSTGPGNTYIYLWPLIGIPAPKTINMKGTTKRILNIAIICLAASECLQPHRSRCPIPKWGRSTSPRIPSVECSRSNLHLATGRGQRPQTSLLRRSWKRRARSRRSRWKIQCLLAAMQRKDTALPHKFSIYTCWETNAGCHSLRATGELNLNHPARVRHSGGHMCERAQMRFDPDGMKTGRSGPNASNDGREVVVGRSTPGVRVRSCGFGLFRPSR